MFQFEPIGNEILFQDFCMDLFNNIHKTTSFQQYKTKGSAQNGVDIFSSEHKIAIQCKKKKIARSDTEITKELISDIDDTVKEIVHFQFDIKVLYFLTTTKKYGKVQDHVLGLLENSSIQFMFWSWEDIEPYIINYGSLRKKYFPHLWTQGDNLPKILTYIPRIDNNEIVGRQAELELLSNLFATSNRVVLVCGIGGVGKSTLAKLFANKNFETFSHLIWLDVKTADSGTFVPQSTLIIEAFANNLTLVHNLGLDNIELSIAEKFKLILNKISNILGENILIIDNVSDDILLFNEQLPINWKILLTSRNVLNEYPQLIVDMLTDEDTKLLFYTHYTLEVNDRIDDLLKYVGNHTLAVELLAKTANKRRLKIDEVVTSLEQTGLNLTRSARVSVAHDIERKQVDPFEYLVSIFSIAGLTEIQREYLRNFTVLPSRLISYNDLVQLFGIDVGNDNDFFENLTEIVSKGWLKEENGSYHMHQVVKEVLKYKLNPEFSNCEVLVVSIKKMTSFEYKDSFLWKLPYLDIADSIVSNLYNGQIEFAVLLNNAGILHDHSGNAITAIKYYEMLLSLKQANSIPEKDIHHVYINLAVSWLRQGEYQKALAYNLTNVRFLEGQLEYNNSLTLAMSYNNLAENYRCLGQFDKTLEFSKKSIVVYESSGSKEDTELATAYNSLSNYYSAISERRLSLKYGLIALSIREKKLDEFHPLLAQSYNNLGVDYEKLGEFDKALKLHEKAIFIREKIFTFEHSDLAESYNNIAQVYFGLNQISEAIPYYNKAITIRERVLIQNHPDIAIVYNNLASAYLTEGQLELSRYNFEKAVLMYSTNNNCTPTYALSLFNFSQLLFIQAETVKAETTINSAIEIFTRTLGKNHQQTKLALMMQQIIKRTNSGTKNTTLGRNELCFCGSGRKYKKCHGKI